MHLVDGLFSFSNCLSRLDFCEQFLIFIESVIVDPQVEAALQLSNYVDNIMVHADPYHNYCVALVVPSRQALENWAQGAGIQHSNFSELCEKAESITEVQQSLSKVCCISVLS